MITAGVATALQEFLSDREVTRAIVEEATRRAIALAREADACDRVRTRERPINDGFGT